MDHPEQTRTIRRGRRTGHAGASDKRGWLLPADVIHAAAAGAWPGGLLPLALLLNNARGQPKSLPAAIAVTRRSPRVSVAAVGALAITGSLNGYALLGAFDGLWTTVYGRRLVCKAALFAAMIILGATNKRSIERRPVEENPRQPSTACGATWPPSA